MGYKERLECPHCGAVNDDPEADGPLEHEVVRCIECHEFFVYDREVQYWYLSYKTEGWRD